ncbi:MAG: alpha/beta hydrolase [Ottowia sp.]|uniref:RBBP9/YdeN family alpha/beta hydrolase n=1 Tax=Ottowia sp. TaxID=1898956 RepID=UPI003C7799C5
MAIPQVLILPGWQGSGAGHWQSRWEVLYGYQRVEQHDWMRPLRGDWMLRLEEEVLKGGDPLLSPGSPKTKDAPPGGRGPREAGERGGLFLVAHSLGCILVAWWAAHSRHTDRVAGALLVAPPDIERDDNRQAIPGWTPVQRQRLPFKSVLVASSDDPFCSLDHASRLAADWGASFYRLGAKGHINADSGLGDWEEGHALLANLSHS